MGAGCLETDGRNGHNLEERAYETDSSGKTPLAYAAMAGYRDIYELLIEKGARFDFFDCSAAGDLRRVKKLIADGIYVTNTSGSTALVLASMGQ